MISVLMTIFALSGAAALIYQVCWQRILFVSFGVDIESTTIIVSTFMLGLGVGALAGGRLADRVRDRQLELFALAEAGIGLFGLVSPHFLAVAARHTYDLPLPAMAVVNFGLMLVPTTFMGATLPILVTYLVRNFGNVGVSVGRLYASNTLGACLGSIAAGMVLFVWLTLNQAIYLAAAMNFLIAGSAYLLCRRRAA